MTIILEKLREVIRFLFMKPGLRKYFSVKVATDFFWRLIF